MCQPPAAPVVAANADDVVRARARSEQRVAFFSGHDALQEVAKVDGLWNWALVGPDSEGLPLSGGGMGGIEEMGGAIGRHPHSFGLLRMNFGGDANATAKFVFIHASDPIDSGNFSARERGQALGVEPEMDRALRKFAAFSTKVQIHDKEDCTVEHLVERVRGHVRGVRLQESSQELTIEKFREAVDYHKEQNCEEWSHELERQASGDFLASIARVPAPVEAMRTIDEVDEDSVEDEDAFSEAEVEVTPSIQRRRVKLYTPGDMVKIYSHKHNEWMHDGEVSEVVFEACRRDNQSVRAGSSKVVYANGKRFKWLTPTDLHQYTKKSPRERAPEPIVGHLELESYDFLGSSWQRKYFELSRGFLQWWSTEQEAQNRVKPSGSIYMLGLQEQGGGDCIRFRTDQTGGAFYAIRCQSAEDGAALLDAFWLHELYCEDEYAFFNELEGRTKTKLDVVDAMVRSHSPRKSIARSSMVGGLRSSR